MQLFRMFHSSKVNPIRIQPYERLQTTLLGVTLLKDLNQPIRSDLDRGL